MTLDEAAKELGIPWRIVRSWMLRLGWITMSSGASRPTCCHHGVKGRFVEPIVRQHISLRGAINVEVGYHITPTGLAALRHMGSNRQ